MVLTVLLAAPKIYPSIQHPHLSRTPRREFQTDASSFHCNDQSALHRAIRGEKVGIPAQREL